MIVVAFRIIFNTRAKRLQNMVNGDDHVTTIHVFDMSSKLTKSLSYYVAHLILTFLSAYLIPQQQHSEFEDISNTTNTLVISYNATYHFGRMPGIKFIILCPILISCFSENIQSYLTRFTTATRNTLIRIPLAYNSEFITL